MTAFEIVTLSMISLLTIALYLLVRVNIKVAEQQLILNERLDVVLGTLDIYRQGTEDMEPMETEAYTDNNGKYIIMRKRNKNG